MKFRLTGTVLLAISLLLFILINTIVWVQVSNRIEAYSDNLYETESLRANARLSDAHNRINRLYSRSKKDVLFLKDLVEIDLKEAKSLTLTQKIILEFVKRDKGYFQARFIDTLGMEIFKIEQSDKKVENIDKSHLQDKGDRDYFRKSILLADGEIFVSKLGLNIERGKVEMPYRPTVRFFTPVFANGNKVGIVGLNLNIKNWFQVFEDMNLGILNSENEVYLNPNGNLYGKSDIDFKKTDPNNRPLFFSKKISLEGNHFWTLYTRENNAEMDKKLKIFKKDLYTNAVVLSMGILFILIISVLLFQRKRKIIRLNRSIASQLSERDTLIKEIHHRVKNNLQVVSSLLSLQSSFVKDESSKAMLRYCQYRIKSMGMVHQMLYSSDNLDRIDFGAYIDQLANTLISSMKGTNSGMRLVTDIENIMLNIDTAIPLGLMINEIITNSLKYGFPGDTAGSIDIKIDQLGPIQYKLMISDNGQGFSDDIDFRNTKSLGLKLIHKLSLQLRGTVEKNNSKKGTAYIIPFQEIEQKS